MQVSNAHRWHGDRKLARANEQEEQKQKQKQKQREEAKQRRKQRKAKKRQQQQKQAKQRQQQNGGGETRVSTLSSSGARSGDDAKARVYSYLIQVSTNLLLAISPTHMSASFVCVGRTEGRGGEGQGCHDYA